jgi:two-component system, OmpR family, phosphate regulon response regulator OmpR
MTQETEKDSAPKKRLLVLDDDAELRGMLQRYLSEQGFEVRAVQDAAHLDRLLLRETFDLLVLDLMMPGEDGLSICRRLRVGGEMIPIIMLTAKGDPVDRIVGLEMGADDYLPKPFNPRELSARINAQLRRQAVVVSRAQLTRDEVVSFGLCKVDLSARTVTRSGESLDVGTREFNLLATLIANPGRALGRERLIELAYGTLGNDGSINDRAIDVQVVRLRKAVEVDPANPRYIQTVWGVGYMFAPDAKSS